MVEKVHLRTDPPLDSLPLSHASSQNATSQMTSIRPSSMSEAAPKTSQITTRSPVPGVSTDVLYEKRIDFQPCCLQFSLQSPKHLVVGTYNLEDPAIQSRNGSLLLYVLCDEKLTLVDTYVHTSGILDIRFNPSPQRVEKFAVASSSGSISIFELKGTSFPNDDGKMGEINHLNTFQLFSESAVITSLAWHKSENGPLAVTTSEGKVAVLNFCGDYNLLHEQSIVTNHRTNEAWTVVFALDKTQKRTRPDGRRELEARFPHTEFESTVSVLLGVYSGGDDSRLRLAKFERDSSGRTQLKPKFGHIGPSGLGGHNAGVTAILALVFPTVETTDGQDILVTGSYDDHVRVYAVYDYRQSTPDAKPAVLAELNVGSGVWRLTFLEDYSGGGRPPDHPKDQYVSSSMPNTAFRILASCMQGGARVLEVVGSIRGEWTIRILAELQFNTGNDLVYAGDIQPAVRDELHAICGYEGGDEEKYIFVSGNFYEKQLCVWRYYKPAPILSPKSSYLKSRNKLYGLDSDENS